MTDRTDGRALDELRPVKFTRGCSLYAEGSCFVEWGNTKVFCTASVEDKVPLFMRGRGTGWVSAEYGMLPRSTQERMQRDISKGKPNARGTEIQRLIGRSLRAAVDMSKLGENTIWLDCDVIQADGGTRTASISAGFVALFDALRWLAANGKTDGIPLKEQVAAVSAGKVGGVPMKTLSLCPILTSTSLRVTHWWASRVWTSKSSAVNSMACLPSHLARFWLKKSSDGQLPQRHRHGLERCEPARVA
jgi:ribonuclease PH